MCGVDEAPANGNCADHGDLLEHFTSPNLCALDQRTLHIFGSVLMLRRKSGTGEGKVDLIGTMTVRLHFGHIISLSVICRGKMLTTDMTPESNLHRRLSPPSPTGY